VATCGAGVAVGDADHWFPQRCKGGVAVNEKEEILALDDKRFGAMIGRDFKALQAMVHDDLLYTHSSGVTDTKASWLESMQSGKTKYKSVNCTERKVRVIGEVALVTGRATIEAEIGGQPRSLKLLFLNAWAKTPQEGWKFVAWQSTPLAA
jgi:ketosteroid isomerase-like protein